MSFEKVQETIDSYHKQTTDGIGLLKTDIDNLKRELAFLNGDPRRPGGDYREVPATGGGGNAIDDGYKYISNDLQGKKIRVLNRDQRLVESIKLDVPDIKPDENYIVNMVRQKLGMRLPENTVVSTSAVVPNALSSNIIDDVRAKSTVMRAGTSTIPVTVGGTTTFGRLTGDPTVYEHTEATEDIIESDILLDAVQAKPITIAGLVPVSMELLQDSSNIQAMMNTAFSAAFSGKIDNMFLTALLADTDIPTSAAGQATATWAGILSAVTAALAADQDLPSAFIGSEADFMARASLTDGNGAWLGKPPVLANMSELYSTRIDDGTAIFGNFAAGAALCTWVNDFNIEVIKFQNPNALIHLCVAYLRVKPLILQPKHLFIQQATVA